MKLPNGEKAIVDIEKLIGYCLNPEHPRGKHKARVFLSACGFTAENAETMREQLFEAAAEGEATRQAEIGYGQRYVIEWNITGPAGTALVRSAWLVPVDSDIPRFVSAFVV